MKIQRKWKFVLIIAVAIILLIVARGCGSMDKLTAPESTARTLMAPFAAVGDFFSNMFDFDTKKNLEKQLDAANKDLAKYKAAASLSAETASENQRLRDLLDLQKTYAKNWDMCVATVKGREIDNWYERLLINKGYADGVEPNMAVVNEYGLVGRTTNVTEKSSEVLLILDAKGSLGGMTQGSRIPGVLTGIGGGKGLLNMSNLPFNAELQLNDVVVTSGEGGIFPGGLLVGSVVKVGNSLDGLSKEAIIEPFCKFDSISEVLILIPSKEKPKDTKKTTNTDNTTDGSTTDENTDGTTSNQTTDNTDNADNTDSGSNGGSENTNNEGDNAG
ncbi:MAG: rod shape-determining protein MreC [Clostridiales bacterium]